MKRKPNEEIRQLMRESGVHQWEVADELGIHEITLLRWMRHPMDEEKTERVKRAIERLTTQSAPFN